MSKENNDSEAFDMPSWAVTGGYLLLLGLAGAGLAVLSHFWGDKLLLSFSDLTGDDISGEGLAKVWFIFAWALGATLVQLLIQGSAYSYTSRTVRLFKGTWASLNAGIFEELIFRWLLFFIAMITLPFFNIVTFGLLKWLYVEVLIPVANFFTFGGLESYLIGGSSWVLGAAIISANVSFRDAHKGWFTRINAWFIGMVMFYLVLNYGIQTAITAHVLYDVIVFAIAALAVEAPRQRYEPVVWNTGWNESN